MNPKTSATMKGRKVLMIKNQLQKEILLKYTEMHSPHALYEILNMGARLKGQQFKYGYFRSGQTTLPSLYLIPIFEELLDIDLIPDLNKLLGINIHDQLHRMKGKEIPLINIDPKLLKIYRTEIQIKMLKKHKEMHGYIKSNLLFHTGERKSTIIKIGNYLSGRFYIPSIFMIPLIEELLNIDLISDLNKLLDLDINKMIDKLRRKND